MKLIICFILLSSLIIYLDWKIESDMTEEKIQLHEQLKDAQTQYNAQVEVLNYYQRLVEDKRCQEAFVPLREELK